MAPLSAMLVLAFAATALALPAKFTKTQKYKNLGLVTDMAFLPDGLMLIATFDGKIFLANPESSKNNEYVLYMEIDDIDTKGERGLVSLELDPDFRQNSTLKGKAQKRRKGKGERERKKAETERKDREKRDRERQRDSRSTRPDVLSRSMSIPLLLPHSTLVALRFPHSLTHPSLPLSLFKL